MKKSELLYHLCEYYMDNNSLVIKTPKGHIVNKTTAQVFDLKNKLYNKLKSKYNENKIKYWPSAFGP